MLVFSCQFPNCIYNDKKQTGWGLKLLFLRFHDLTLTCQTYRPPWLTETPKSVLLSLCLFTVRKIKKTKDFSHLFQIIAFHFVSSFVFEKITYRRLEEDKYTTEIYLFTFIVSCNWPHSHKWKGKLNKDSIHWIPGSVCRDFSMIFKLSLSPDSPIIWLL